MKLHGDPAQHQRTCAPILRMPLYACSACCRLPACLKMRHAVRYACSQDTLRQLFAAIENHGAAVSQAHCFLKLLAHEESAD